jgi:hypothetical protein
MYKKLLLTLLIIGVSTILTACNITQQNNPNEPGQQQPIQKDLCSDLDEEECLNIDNCQGVYGPSTCSGNICTTDVAFKDCREIPDEVSEEAGRDKTLCQDTGGQWQTSRYNKLGRCECQESYFRANEGCMSMEEDCKKFGGTVYRTGTLKCDEHLREIDSYTCPKNAEYNTFEECLCPNGETWDYLNRCS